MLFAAFRVNDVSSNVWKHFLHYCANLFFIWIFTFKDAKFQLVDRSSVPKSIYNNIYIYILYIMHYTYNYNIYIIKYVYYKANNLENVTSATNRI